MNANFTLYTSDHRSDKFGFLMVVGQDLRLSESSDDDSD